MLRKLCLMLISFGIWYSIIEILYWNTDNDIVLFWAFWLLRTSASLKDKNHFRPKSQLTHHSGLPPSSSKKVTIVCWTLQEQVSNVFKLLCNFALINNKKGNVKKTRHEGKACQDFVRYSLYIIWTTYQDLLQVQDHKNENDSQGTF